MITEKSLGTIITIHFARFTTLVVTEPINLFNPLLVDLVMTITPIFSSVSLYFICMFLATFTHKQKKMIGISLGIVFISYVLQTLSSLSNSVEFLKYLSIFTLADIRNVITDISLNPLIIVVSIIISIIFLALTIIKYNHKELV